MESSYLVYDHANLFFLLGGYVVPTKLPPSEMEEPGHYRCTASA